VDTLDELAQRQYSLVSYKQARAAGLSQDAIRNLHERGSWQQLRRSVSVMRGAPRSWEQSVLAAILATRHGAWASHDTVLRLWGLTGRGVTTSKSPRLAKAACASRGSERTGVELSSRAISQS